MVEFAVVAGQNSSLLMTTGEKMIRILIYTNNVEGWFAKVISNVSNYIYLRTRSGYFVQNELFIIEIISSLPIETRGKKFSNIIIDKPINKGTYENIVMTMQFGSGLIKTENFDLLDGQNAVQMRI